MDCGERYTGNRLGYGKKKYGQNEFPQKTGES